MFGPTGKSTIQTATECILKESCYLPIELKGNQSQASAISPLLGLEKYLKEHWHFVI